MPKHIPGKRRTLTVILTEEEYNQVRVIASKANTSMSELVRSYLNQGICGEVTESNIDFLAPIIREQLQSVLEPKMERMISLQAKTCIQASTATYLAADAILKFVPPGQRTEVKESYDAAKKQAIIFMKSKTDMNEEE